MESIAMVGLAFGVRHAMDADHIAAVASLAVRSGHHAGDAVRLATCWGIGHGTAILAMGATALIAGARVPESFIPFFESAVGLMLLALGIDAICRRHLTMVRTAAVGSKAAVPHRRAILVGGIHGVAGSTALALLSATQAHSPIIGFTQLALFAAGAVGGMVLLSLVLSLPLACLRGRTAQLAASVTVGLATASVGVGILLRSASLD